MKILGISSLDTDSTASLVIDGKLIESIAEERLSRKKMHAGFPHKSIEMLLQRNGLTVDDIDHVTYSFYSWQKAASQMFSRLGKNLLYNLTAKDTITGKLRHAFHYFNWTIAAIVDHRKYDRELLANLKKMGLIKKFVRVEHHLSHAASAFYTSGMDKALIVTADLYGGGLAGSISLGTPKGIERTMDIPFPDSLGLFYSQVTKALGFKPGRHEGKIVGLAAFGDEKVLFDKVYNKFDITEEGFRYISAWDKSFCKNLTKKHTREDIAAAYQSVLEKVVVDMVAKHVKKHKAENICLAGGIMANVKLNQRIFAIDGVKNIFVFPNMGDGGTAAGAALSLHHEHNKDATFEQITNVYLGPSYSNEEIKKEIDKENLPCKYFEEIEKEIAVLLSQNNVVARFNGKMEYGPRSLGNRSILYPAVDPKVNKWLNDRLGRTEFMPFAPATLYEYRDQCYKNMAGAEHAATFMTVTMDCTDYMKENSPAAVHVDGTARPQLVTPEINLSYYKILKEYHNITTIPSLINTSYNMHEEPIVCSPADGVRAFLDGKLEYLAIGNYLVTNPKLKEE